MKDYKKIIKSKEWEELASDVPALKLKKHFNFCAHNCNEDVETFKKLWVGGAEH
jgi:hypothetical protein